MDPDDIVLINTSQQFEYERMSREIDEVDDVEERHSHINFEALATSSGAFL